MANSKPAGRQFRLRRAASNNPLLQGSPLFQSFGGLGLNIPGLATSIDSGVRKQPSGDKVDGFGSGFSLPNSSPVDLQSVANGGVPGLAPIPVPGFPGPVDSPSIPGVNTIPGLDMFNYLVGNLIPQAIPPANQLLGGSLSRLLPQDQTKNLAKSVFTALAAPASNVDVDRMMGRWFQVQEEREEIRCDKTKIAIRNFR